MEFGTDMIWDDWDDWDGIHGLDMAAVGYRRAGSVRRLISGDGLHGIGVFDFFWSPLHLALVSSCS